jgi:hypothetical protein
LHKGILPGTRLPTRLGFACFVTGLLGSELLLFLQGTLLWASYGFLPLYYEGLFGVSVLIPLGALLVVWGGRIRWA